MTKKTALWLMIAGAAVSVYDMSSGGKVYGPGAPLEKMKVKVITQAGPPAKDWYLTVSDAAAVVGAYFYLR
jgi:hypothetical protein